MTIGFLHQLNDPYTIVRMKYFILKGHRVISISFPQKDKKQKNIKNLINIYLPELYINRVFLLKRIIYFWHIFKITKDNDLDILHVVNAESMILSFFSRSKKVVIENQGSDVLFIPKQYPWVKFLYRFFYRFVDAVIQDSKVAQEAGIELGAPIEFNEVINIGIDFNIFNKNLERGLARKKFNIDDEKIVFSSRGMKSIYNIDTIIKTIPNVRKHFPNVKFMFASSYGEFSEDINIFIDENNLQSNILYTGWLDHENEIPYLNMDADIVVSVPSTDSSPFSVYEAMATMTPVIVSDLLWLKDKFISGKDLISVPVKDEFKLSEKIIELLKTPNIIDTNHAYRVVYDHINKDTENLKLEELYNALLI